MTEDQQAFDHDVNEDNTKTKLKADDRDKVIGSRLRSRRKLLGLTQRELGKIADITFQQIQKYENGKNKVSAIRLMDFCKVLNVPITYFYAGLADIGKKTPASMQLSDTPQEQLQDDIMVKKETIDLVKSYYEISDEKIRQTMLRTIKSMAKLSKEDDD